MGAAAGQEPRGSTLAELDRELQATFARSAGSVFRVAAPDPGRRGWARVGSGFILEGTNGIVTTESLVAGASHAYVWIDGEETEARVVGSDPLLNVAVLALPESVHAGGLPAGDSKAIRAGSFVVAIGCGNDHEPEPALGLVAGRKFGVFQFGGLPAWHLRTSVTLSPELVGGPLLSCRGEVIGLTVGSPHDSSHTYALATETLVRAVRIIEERGGRVQHGWIGVRVEPIEAGDDDGMRSGVRVGEIRLRSPASGAGLRRGDRILGIDGRDVGAVADVFDIMLGMEIGQTADIAIAREGENSTVAVTIGERPAARIMPPVPLPANAFPPLPFGDEGNVPEILLPPSAGPVGNP